MHEREGVLTHGMPGGHLPVFIPANPTNPHGALVQTSVRAAFSRVASCTLVLLVLASVASAQVTAIRAGRLVDPESGTISTNQVILVENGKFSAVGSNVPFRQAPR